MDSLLAMGFAEYQVKKAMQECGGNAEAAANYIMGHLDEPEEFWFTAPVASTAPARYYLTCTTTITFNNIRLRT